MTDPNKQPGSPSNPQVEEPAEPSVPGVGSHGTGTAVGTLAGGLAAGAALGATAGLAGGPVGVIAGLALGSIAGALAGNAIAEVFNPDEFWSKRYQTRPYVAPNSDYELYRDAYQLGHHAPARNAGRSFDDVESQLAAEWEADPNRPLPWAQARHAAMDAWKSRLETHPSSSPSATTTPMGLD